MRFHLIPGCARRLKLHLEFDGPAGSESHEAHHPRDIPKMGHVKMENHGKITDKWNLNQPKYIYIYTIYNIEDLRIFRFEFSSQNDPRILGQVPNLLGL